MSITDPWVLPKGIVITPVEELPSKLREQVEARDGDFAISRPQSRTPSRILDPQSAALLREFETPRTIGQAVAYYSHSVGIDPERTLEDALPMLTQVIAWRLLVSPNSPDADEIQPSLQVGAVAADCEVLQCFQALEDSEVYRVRRASGEVAALKILRSNAHPESRNMFDREAAILRQLAGSVSPALLDSGIWENRRYLLLEWCEGVDAGSAAAMLYQDRTEEAQRKLFHLCCEILDTYSRLHNQGVTHSDIHPRNLLVDDANKVRIVDFGVAAEENINEQLGEPARAGVGFYFEPEYAAAIRQQRQPPSASSLGEQYALAALLYSLLTGANYVDFSLTRDEMMRQIEQDGPVPFSQRGMSAWPEVERVLAKALSKVPSERFASVSEFAHNLRAVQVPPDGWMQPPPDSTALNRVLDRELARVGFSGDVIHDGLPTAPKASLTYGAAGVAYAMYRLACGRDDPGLLSLADVWCRRALSKPDSDESYYNAEIEITPEIVGSIAPYHTLSGIHAVKAMVSHAMCDVASHADALEGFMLASQKPCDNLDLALGRSGTLLVASLLLDMLGSGEILQPAPLLAFGNQVMQAIWQEIDKQPPVQEGTVITYPGIAHGWAGILYATLCWHNSSGAELPHKIEDRLQQLMECAEPWGRGVRWPWVLAQGRHGGAPSYMPGWCNGTAGHIFLWTAAHRIFENEAYLQLAEKSAWHIWESNDSITNLCCGLAGQSYGLLNLYKHSGASIWLDRARTLACRAAAWDTDNYLAMKFAPESLYKGELGVALLASELSAPETACMPFFESEGWPTVSRPAFRIEASADLKERGGEAVRSSERRP